MYVCYNEFEKQVKEQVRIIIQAVFPTLDENEFEAFFEKDEWVAFMKRDIYLRYQEGDVPFLKVDVEKDEFILGIVSSMKDSLGKEIIMK